MIASILRGLKVVALSWTQCLQTSIHVVEYSRNNIFLERRDSRAKTLFMWTKTFVLQA